MQKPIMRNKGRYNSKYEDIKEAIENVDTIHFENFKQSFMDTIQPALTYAAERRYTFNNNKFLIDKLIARFGNKTSKEYLKCFVEKSILRAAKENELPDGTTAEPLISKALFNAVKELDY
tara:strand:+ start:45 stop:404 length:360 start_codon:yes stop_codon:yes gene_type:complete